MLGKIRELFQKQTASDVATVDAERLQVATCVILLEIASADRDFAPEECEHIVATLRRRFALSQEDAEELIRESTAIREESHDFWRFTRVINEACTPAEKSRIVEEIWRVIYADGTLDAHEDHLVHRFATLLNLSHRQLIDAKRKVLAEQS